MSLCTLPVSTCTLTPPKPHPSSSSSLAAEGAAADANCGLERYSSSLSVVKDPFLVTLEGREHLSPHQWGVAYRWFLTAFAVVLVFNVTFTSAAPSNLIPDIINHFHASEEVGMLLISTSVAGYCLGPVFWGPFSERYGRKVIFIITFIPYIAFQVGCALAPNIGTLLVFRFLAGAFSSSPMTNSGGIVSDIWSSDQRGDAVAIFAVASFAGPCIAPVVAGFLHVAGTDWRWVFWITGIFAGVCFVIIPFYLPETYVPYILHQEAKRLRKVTGDDRWHAALDDGSRDIRSVLNRTVFKPFSMVCHEPMLAIITLYMSFISGVLYLLLEAIPIIFADQHGLNEGLAALAFVALLGGIILGVLGYIVYFNRNYKALHRRLFPRAVPPEAHLQPVIFAAPALAVYFSGLPSSRTPLSASHHRSSHWPCWGLPASHFVTATLGTTRHSDLCNMFMFFPVIYIYIGCLNYIVDCYLINAASGLAVNTISRYLFATVFPLFARQMYFTLGTPGATSILGGIATVFIPVPLLLHKYGKVLRGWSKSAVVRLDE